MLSRLHRPAQRADVNWAPLSEVMVAGTPKRDTHPAKRALAQSAAARPGPRGGGRNGSEVQESPLVVGVCVCELCPSGTAGRPWPSG